MFNSIIFVFQLKKMNKISNYCVVSVNDVLQFTDGINMLISQGWQPFGSICVHPSNSDRTISLFVQAMVKYEEQGSFQLDKNDFQQDV